MKVQIMFSGKCEHIHNIDMELDHIPQAGEFITLGERMIVYKDGSPNDLRHTFVVKSRDLIIINPQYNFVRLTLKNPSE